jgi:hypothetical protein
MKSPPDPSSINLDLLAQTADKDNPKFAVSSQTPPEENRTPAKVLKKDFPPMEIELVGRRYVAHMEYNGQAASENLPLYFGYLETEKEKHNCLRMHKIVNKLLKKVGFEH